MRKWGYYVCVCMITRRRKREWREHSFLTPTLHHHTPIATHCHPTPSFLPVLFLESIGCFSHIRQQSQPFLCHNLTAWCSVVQLHTGMAKHDKLIDFTLHGRTGSIKSRNRICIVNSVLSQCYSTCKFWDIIQFLISWTWSFQHKIQLFQWATYIWCDFI